MSRLRFLNAGESHGPALDVILEGFPAGLPVDRDALRDDLARRQRAFGAGGRMKIEQDDAEITGGVLGGRTTGAPIAMRVVNRDWANWADRAIDPMTTPRPGHADLVAALKYGYDDLRLGLERASARETATRVAVGALCRQLLGAFGIEVGGYVVGLGGLTIDAPDSVDASDYARRAEVARGNDLCVPDDAVYQRARAEVEAAIRAKDTLGGVFEVFATGLPPGLGSHVHWDRKLDGRLAQALVSIQAMKGVTFGPAFENAARRGTQVHDEIVRDDDGTLRRTSNRAGGLEGGMSTGAPLVARVAMKPIATTLAPLSSVDLVSGEARPITYERSDISAVPRAVPIGESMMAFVLADALVEKLGGDSLDEMRPRFDALARSHLDDVSLHGRPWRFDGKTP